MLSSEGIDMMVQCWLISKAYQLMFSTVRCYGKLAHVICALTSSRSQIKDAWSGNEIL